MKQTDIWAKLTPATYSLPGSSSETDFVKIPLIKSQLGNRPLSMQVIADVYLSVSQSTLMIGTFRISAPISFTQVTQLMSSLHSLIHYLHLTRVIHLDSYHTL